MVVFGAVASMLDCGGVGESAAEDDEVCFCGGSRTGTPVRECRSGGMTETDCEVGERMSSRRGLAMWRTCLEGFAGEAVGDGAEAMMSSGRV